MNRSNTIRTVLERVHTVFACLCNYSIDKATTAQRIVIKSYGDPYFMTVLGSCFFCEILIFIEKPTLGSRNQCS